MDDDDDDDEGDDGDDNGVDGGVHHQCHYHRGCRPSPFSFRALFRPPPPRLREQKSRTPYHQPPPASFPFPANQIPPPLPTFQTSSKTAFYESMQIETP